VFVLKMVGVKASGLGKVSPGHRIRSVPTQVSESLRRNSESSLKHSSRRLRARAESTAAMVWASRLRRELRGIVGRGNPIAQQPDEGATFHTLPASNIRRASTGTASARPRISGMATTQGFPIGHAAAFEGGPSNKIAVKDDRENLRTGGGPS